MAAVYPVTGGRADYSSSSTSTSRFIPTVWSSKLLRNFYESSVYASISNTDHQGQIKGQGDTVVIRTTPAITVNDYVKGQKLSYELPESADVELLIDKGKSFSFQIDDVDKAQMDIKAVNAWSQDAGERMKIAIDTDVLNAIDADAHASNIGNTAGAKSGGYILGASGSPVGITKSNIIDYVEDCVAVLDEQSIPQEGRWMVIPVWMRNYLMKSDLKNADAMGDGTSVLRNGQIGKIDGITFYVTNNYTSVTDSGGRTAYSVLFGTKEACTFASQVTEMETLRNPETFGDLIRGLQVYGYKVVQPKALGVLYCYKA